MLFICHSLIDLLVCRKSVHLDYLAPTRQSAPRTHFSSNGSQTDLSKDLPTNGTAINLTETEVRIDMSPQYEEMPQNLVWPKVYQRNVTQIPDTFDHSGFYYWCPTRSIEDSDIVSNLEACNGSIYNFFFT